MTEKNKEERLRVEAEEEQAPRGEEQCCDAMEEVTGEKIKRLEEEIEELKRVTQENYDKFLRACADLENSKKRLTREKEEGMKYAVEGVILEMLPVIDNLERALEHVSAGQDNQKSLVEGVKLTIDQMKSALEKFGVKEIKAVGEVFDPALHHAITHEESSDVPAGVVLKEFQKGYFLKDKLLRPSLVSVTKSPDDENKDGEGGQG
ncbi:MAG: hypothetical protein BMS9Abin23_1133 [Thermodesulfobacteriota bacterium]|nr:MAG: hypothetical protein BMS9Abin23_1133 [Thermodesulfobacteriota bacterium]